jgi:hypothetical protein
MERALEPERDDRHEVRSAVGRDGGQPVVLCGRRVFEAVEGDRPRCGLGLAFDDWRFRAWSAFRHLVALVVSLNVVTITRPS